MTFTLVPVTGQFRDAQGNAATGVVRLQLTAPLYQRGKTVNRVPRQALLDAEGAVAFTIEATDDPGTIEGCAYEVTLALGGMDVDVYYVRVPHDQGPLSLEFLPRVPEEEVRRGPVVFQPLGERGVPGGYPYLDDSGRIPRDQLPVDLGGGEGGGGVEISGQDSDIQPLGVRAAGASGRAADAAHVHQVPTLSQLRPPTADVAMGGYTLTGLRPGQAPGDAATVAQLGQSNLGWVNARDAAFGVSGDGSKDDSAGLQQALSSLVAGQTLFVPSGTYALSTPLVVPAGVVVTGAGARPVLRPMAAFSGVGGAVLTLAAGGGQRVSSLVVDGALLPLDSAVSGVAAHGDVPEVSLDHLVLSRLGHGVLADGEGGVYPSRWRINDVLVKTVQGNGLRVTRMSGMSASGVEVREAQGDGIWLDNTPHVSLSHCRVELCGRAGLRITGAWGNGTGSGGGLVSGCITRRNAQHGVLVDANGAPPLTISAHDATGDGRNGGSGGGQYAGVAVTGTLPTLLDGLVVYPGIDDDGTGAPSPQYGVRLAGACQVQLVSGALQGVVAGYRDESVGGTVSVGAGVSVLAGATDTANARQQPWSGGPVAKVDALVGGGSPFFIAHRGSGMEAPEHTMAAYEAAVAGGATAIEVSVNISSDGVPVCVHDQTLDRTTTGTGAVSDWSYQALRQSVRTKAQPLLGPGWAEQPLPTLRDVLDRFLGRVVVFLECKSNASVAPVQQLLTTYYPHLLGSLVWKGHYLGVSFPWAKARGIRTWAYLDANTTDEQIAATGLVPDYWGVPHTMADARIRQIVARELPVICWEVHRRSDVTRLSALGVRGMMCAQMQYVRRATQLSTTDEWRTGVKAPGDMGTVTYSDNRALKYDTSDGSVYLDVLGASALIGSRSIPLPPETGHRITVDMKYRAVPAATEHAGIAFGKIADDPYLFGTKNPSGGYHLVLRGNGQMQLFTHAPDSANGVQTGATVATDAPVAGQYMSFQVDLTPTGVTVTRTDMASKPQITSPSTDFRGGYMHVSAGSVSNLANRAHWRNLKVTPL